MKPSKQLSQSYHPDVQSVLEQIRQTYGEGAVRLALQALEYQRSPQQAHTPPLQTGLQSKHDSLSPVLLGRSMPSRMGLIRAARTALRMGCTALQVFAGDPDVWNPTTLKEDVIKAFVGITQSAGVRAIVLHASLKIDLATPIAEDRERSLILLRSAVHHAKQLKATSIVVHMGNCGGLSVQAGSRRLIEGIIFCWPPAPRHAGTSLLLLENGYGKPGALGSRVEEIGAIFRAIPEWCRKHVGVCLDTAHLWSAGYALSTPEDIHHLLQEVDRHIGLLHVKVIHLNNAVFPCGSRKDQHARWNEGCIPPQGLKMLLNDPRLRHTTFVLETPLPRSETTHKEDWTKEQQHFDLVKQVMKTHSL